MSEPDDEAPEDTEDTEDTEAAIEESTTSSRPRGVGGPRRVLAVVAAVLLVAVLAAAGIGYAVHRHGRLPADAVFRYEGRTYSQSDLAHYDQLQHALYGIAVPDLAQATQRRAAAQTYAVSLVVDRAAARSGVSVSAAEVSAAEADFVQRTYPAGRSSFIDALAAEGLSEADVLDELRRQLVIKQLYDTVTAHVTVDDAAVTTAYHQHVGDFVDPETRLVAEIVVARRDTALALKRQLERGADFAAAARVRSLDATTSSKGGSLGYVARSQLQGPFGAAAFAARQGQVFGPVRAIGADYYYLGVVDAIRPGHTQPLSAVRSQLGQELAAARGLSTWEAYLTKQLAAAGVEYAAAYRPADPDAVPTADLASTAPTPGSSDSDSPGADH